MQKRMGDDLEDIFVEHEVNEPMSFTDVAINYVNIKRKQETCRHPDAKILLKEYSSAGAVMYCPDCKKIYKRPLNPDEISEIERELD